MQLGTIAEMLSTERESRNSVDRYAVCLKKSNKGTPSTWKVWKFWEKCFKNFIL